MRAVSLHDFVRLRDPLMDAPASFAPGLEMFTRQFAFECKRELVVVPPSVHQEQDMDDRRRAGHERCREAEQRFCAASGSESPRVLLELAFLGPGSCHE